MKLQPNTSPADRIVRLVMGGSLAVFAVLGLFPRASLPVMAVAGVAIALTGATGYCPAYALLRLSSRPGPARGTGGSPEGSDGLKNRS